MKEGKNVKEWEKEYLAQTTNSFRGYFVHRMLKNKECTSGDTYPPPMRLSHQKV